MKHYFKLRELTIKGIVILILLIIVLGIHSSFNKKLKNITMEKSKYNSYIAKLSIIYSSQKTEIKDSKKDLKIVKENFNKFVNYLENSRIALVNNLSEKEDLIALSLAIKKEYFLNLVKYLYDNQASYVIKSLDFTGIQENYVLLNLNLSYLYSPIKDYLPYFDTPMGLKIKFWKEEFEKLKNQFQQNNQKDQKEEDISSITSTTTPIVKEISDISLKYKGFVKIGNEKYAIIEYKNEELFVKEKSKISVEGYEALLLEVNENFIKLNVNNEFLFFKAEIL